jgi:hypothetical protein
MAKQWVINIRAENIPISQYKKGIGQSCAFFSLRKNLREKTIRDNGGDRIKG